jgi:molybdopterin molybdotransferase
VHDHVRPSLAALGVEEQFWGLALKPGSPAWFGRRGETLVFGLPGNPVSAMVTFVLLVGPSLRAMLGRDPFGTRAEAMIDSDYEKPVGRAHAVRCRLQIRDDGLHATPTGPQGSHVLSSMLGAEALAMIPSESAGVRVGERVAIESLREWSRT